MSIIVFVNSKQTFVNSSLKSTSDFKEVNKRSSVQQGKYWSCWENKVPQGYNSNSGTEIPLKDGVSKADPSEKRMSIASVKHEIISSQFPLRAICWDDVLLSDKKSQSTTAAAAASVMRFGPTNECSSKYSTRDAISIFHSSSETIFSYYYIV
jgi:hypothetical protein